MGNRRPAPVRRCLGAPPRATTDRVVVGVHPHPRAGPLAHQSHADVGDLPAGGHPGRASGRLPPPATTRAVSTAAGSRPAGGTSILAQPARLRGAGAAAVRRGPITTGRWRWCSPACPEGMWCCRCGCPKVRASGRTWPISWPTGASGTRSTWCGSVTAKRPAAGAITPICSSISRGYQSPITRARRDEIPAGRRAGVDANVSNLAIASFPAGSPSSWSSSRSPAPRPAAGRGAGRQRARARQKALDRSRRNTNPDQYGPSMRQHRRAQRRAANGLAAQQITNPGGPRHARADGVPLRAYRHDKLSRRYRRTRCDHAADAPHQSSQTRPRRRGRRADRGRPRQHHHRRGLPHLHLGAVVGQADRPVQPRHARHRPGRRMRSHRRAVLRAGTRSTAMSQHCLCGGARAQNPGPAHPLLPACGLRADRDAISAVLAACVDLADPDDPRTARVDYRLAHALRDGLASQQEWEGSVNRHQPPTPPDGVGSARTGSHHPVASAEQAAPGPPPNRPGPRLEVVEPAENNSPQADWSCMTHHVTS